MWWVRVMIKGWNIFVVKNCQKHAALWAGALWCNKKISWEQNASGRTSFRIRRTTVLGMFKDSVIILDAIRRSFFTKSSSAAMFTSVRLDFGRLLLSSSSTSSLPSWNRKHHLKRLIVSNPHSHEPFAPILLFLSQIDRFEAKFYGNPLFISTIHDV